MTDTTVPVPVPNVMNYVTPLENKFAGEVPDLNMSTR